MLYVVIILGVLGISIIYYCNCKIIQKTIKDYNIHFSIDEAREKGPKKPLELFTKEQIQETEKYIKNLSDEVLENGKGFDTHMVWLAGGSLVAIATAITQGDFPDGQILFLKICFWAFSFSVFATMTSYIMVACVHHFQYIVLRAPERSLPKAIEMYQTNKSESDKIWDMFNKSYLATLVFSKYVIICNFISYFSFVIGLLLLSIAISNY